MLNLKAKDLVMGKPESLHELGYAILERQSIFTISGILGLVMVYFIVFSETMASVIVDIFSIGADDGYEHYPVTQSFLIIILGLTILPVCLKKEFKDLN